MFWVDGSVYIGDWIDGVQHGYGVMIFSNGERKEGLFEGGVFKLEGEEAYIRSIMRPSINNSTNQSHKSGNSKASSK